MKDEARVGWHRQVCPEAENCRLSFCDAIVVVLNNFTFVFPRAAKMTRVCQKLCFVVYPAFDPSPEPLVQDKDRGQQQQEEGGEEEEGSRKMAD